VLKAQAPNNKIKRREKESAKKLYNQRNAQLFKH